MAENWDVSDAFLMKSHGTISIALGEDLANSDPLGETYNGVREQTDWRLWRDAVEAELARRGLPFKPIVW